MKAIENFVNSVVQPNQPQPEIDLFTGLIIFILYLGVLLLLGKYLWNNVITKMIPSFQRIENLWEILGFIVFIIILKRI